MASRSPGKMQTLQAKLADKDRELASALQKLEAMREHERALGKAQPPIDGRLLAGEAGLTMFLLSCCFGVGCGMVRARRGRGGRTAWQEPQHVKQMEGEEEVAMYDL